MDTGPIITGCGLVTALGVTLEQTWQRLLEGRFITNHSAASVAVEARVPRVTQLALVAAEAALENARWGGDVLKDDRTALLIGSSRGPVNEWFSTQSDPGLRSAQTPASEHREDPDRSRAVPLAREIGLHTLADDVARELRMGFGPRMTYSAACASGLQAMIRASLMIQSGEIDRAIVIGAEASLHPLFLACFDRLGVLPGEGIGCRPFDMTREGFLVSEAAAAVCLERPETARPVAVVDRFMLGSDATTITAADPSGRVLRRMLKHVAGGRPVDLVHAHGTGTVANDPVELTAIESECIAAGSTPIVYSHKAALGHSLGASGLMSVVLSCRMHREGIVPGNIRTTTPLVTKHVRLSSAPQNAGVRRSICIAAGFGGPVAAISLACS